MMTVSRRSSFKQRSLGALIALCRPLAIPTQLFFHSDAGMRFVGFSGFIALLIMIAWTFAGASVFMMLFTGLYVIRLMIYRSACEETRKHGGPRRHTQHAGKPLWGMFSTDDKEKEQKLNARETALIVVLGLLITWIDPGAGIFLVVSCVARSVVNSCLETIAHEQMLDLMDQQIEQEEIEEKLAKFHPSPLRPALPAVQVQAELFQVPSRVQTALPMVQIEAELVDVPALQNSRALLALNSSEDDQVRLEAQ